MTDESNDKLAAAIERLADESGKREDALRQLAERLGKREPTAEERQAQAFDAVAQGLKDATGIDLLAGRGNTDDEEAA